MRKAHCLGCGHTFPQMHQLFAHRRTDRCGGRFTPLLERLLYTNHKFYMSEMHRILWYDPEGAAICRSRSNEYWTSFIESRTARLERDGYPDYTRFSMTGFGRKPKHKARVPGTTRDSRLPGGSGFRGWDTFEKWPASGG